MDNLRMEHPGPLSKSGSAHHLLSFSTPSIDFSTQHNKPPHNSSSNSHQLQLQAPWPLHWAEQHYHQPSPIHTPPAVKNRVENHDDGLCRTWDISDPILQLKHGGTSVSAGFPHQGARIDALRRDATHSSGVFVAASPLMEKGSSFPVSLSGSRAIPFACKLDAPKARDMGFASLSGYDRDESERNSGRAKEAVATVKAEVVGGSSAGLKGSDGGGTQQLGSSTERKAVVVKEEQEGGVTIASLEDGSIGLKLGKRTYYEDAGGEEAIKRGNNSNSSNGNTTTINNNNSNNNNNNSNNGGVSKKHKGSSLNTTVPRCQAEGCKADLSGAKDYHRRHKVCEWHSKASKAKVANLEQRFCQQCSRFHVLSEFDEGKRSCRRRLAGHNERRRKPPPEPMSLLSPGSFAYFADGRANASLLDHPYFLQHRRAAMVSSSLNNATLACQLGLAGLPQEEGLALELHHFMQGLPPGGGAGAGLLDGGRALMVVANGHGLALSNPPGPSLAASPPSSSRVGLIHDPQPSSEMAISGRALSLLSSSLGSPNNPCTMSMSLGMTSPSIDQLFAETHALASSRQIASGPSCFSPGMGIVPSLHDLRHNHNHGVNSLSSSSGGCSPDIEQGKPPTMSIFDGRSMFLMLPENGFQNLQTGGSSQHGRPMLDLMQISSTESHHHQQQQQAEVPYTDLHGLSIFGRQSIM